MEEIELLVKLIASLPTMAIWVIAMFYAYKVIIIGSVFGVIRFGISKLHDYLTKPKVVTNDYKVGEFALNNTVGAALMHQITRLHNHKGSSSHYIHMPTIFALEKVIDEVLKSESKK